MKIKTAIVTLCKRALYESVSTNDMCRFVKIFDDDYDIYRESGIPRNIPISNQNAATQIVNDMLRANRFIDLVEVLVKVSTIGYMGRKYSIKYLRTLITNLQKEGFVYDESTGQLFEDSRMRATPNWGRLLNGDQKSVAVLRLDIVGNSELVKNESAQNIERAYTDLRNIVERAVLIRAGRLWSWEGDGAVAAFVFGKKEKAVLLAGMEILNELFFYNRLHSPLSASLNVRVAAHVGLMRYNTDLTELLKDQIIKEVIMLEGKSTAIDSFSVSPGLFMYIDTVMQDLFTKKKDKYFGEVCQYSITMEKS